MASLPAARRRSGLTLMELIVVLAILISLAAVMIPLFPSMIGRSHKASESTNLVELNKAFQTYAGLNSGAFPDGLDLLGDGTTLAAYLPASPTPNPVAGPINLGNTVGGFLNPQALGTRATALNAVGINNGWAMFATTQADPFTPTFNPYSSTSNPPVATPITSSTVVAFVNPAGIARAGIIGSQNINTASSTQFVLLGVGNRCSAVGKTLANAPHLYTDNPTLENPASFYARFGVIFQVEDINGNPLSVAQFISAVAIESDGIEGVDKDMEGYYQSYAK
jgi:type II secretory pathway pseudopilin PulG